LIRVIHFVGILSKLKKILPKKVSMQLIKALFRKTSFFEIFLNESVVIFFFFQKEDRKEK
jgi:hypothetical protein